MSRHAVVRCAWDSEAAVWYVSASLEALRQKLPGMIEDLLAVVPRVDLCLDLAAHVPDRRR
jgi:hypothetical protein